MSAQKSRPPRRGTHRWSSVRPGLALLLAAAMALAACGGDGDGDAAGGTPFYEGKTIEMILPLAPGGGTDIAMRLMARHLPKHIEGNPTIVVLNEDHGGNSLIAVNEYVRDGSDEGLRIVGLGGSNHSAFLFGNAQVEYTPNGDLRAVAGTQSGGVMVARADTGLTAGSDLKDYDGELFFGGRRPEGSFVKRTLTFELLGIEVNELLGYEGAAALDIAFAQGETNINGVSTSTFLQDNLPEVEAGNQVVLWTEGSLGADGEVGRDTALPDHPHIGELYEEFHGQPPSGAEWEAYKVLAAADGGMDKGLYIHEDAPEEAYEALTAAVDRMLEDPEFLEDAESVLGAYPVLNGEQTAQTVDAYLVNADQGGLDWVRAWAREKYGVDLAEG